MVTPRYLQVQYHHRHSLRGVDSGAEILSLQILNRKPALGFQCQLEDGPSRMRSCFLVLSDGCFERLFVNHAEAGQTT